MIENILGMMGPEIRTTIKIGEGRLKEISKEELRAWVQKFLSPVRDSLREVLDDPENKDLWVSEAECPTAEYCRSLDVAQLDDKEKYRLIGVAVNLHAGNDLFRDLAERAARLIEKCYTHNRDYLLRMKEEYMEMKTQREREDIWLHDIMGVGVAKLDGSALTLFPLDQATRNALDWIAQNGSRSKTTLGPQGGTV